MRTSASSTAWTRPSASPTRSSSCRPWPAAAHSPRRPGNFAAVAPPMLRPLQLGEILDAGIKVVTRNWKPLIVTLLLVVTPVQILSVLVLASVDDTETAFQILPDSSRTATTPSARCVVGLGLGVLMSLIAFLFAFTALFKGVSDAWLGVRPEVRRSLRFGARRAPSVGLLFAVWIVPMIVFTALCGLPALWLGTVWSLSIPALLFERTGPMNALGRSFNLIAGRFWESLLIVLVCVFLTE